MNPSGERFEIAPMDGDDPVDRWGVYEDTELLCECDTLQQAVRIRSCLARDWADVMAAQDSIRYSLTLRDRFKGFRSR